MGIVERDFDCEDLHPIDIVESLASERSWDFDRIADDQIAMAIEGSWRTYSVTLAWSAHDETLRLICAFELAPPARRARVVVEAEAGAFERWSLRVGDRLEVRPTRDADDPAPDEPAPDERGADVTGRGVRVDAPEDGRS